ncbi:Serine/threonine receptor-like kinase NFP [Linum grandiflorum]
MNLRNISDLFGVSQSSIATASNLNDDVAQLAPDQLLLVPVDCGCIKNSSYSNLTYQIRGGDSFYLVSTTSLENLTDWEAVAGLNPGLSPTSLQPGDRVVFPLFCQCPSRAQRENGIELLITYMWRSGDSLQAVADELGASSVDDIVMANNYREFNESINHPVLIPVPGLPVLRRQMDPSSPQRKGSNQHWIIIISFIVAVSVISAVWILYLVVFRIGCGSSCQHKKLKKLKKTVSYEEKLFSGVSGYLDKPTVYDVNAIMEATMDLDSYYRIKGSVYRANIGGTILAVKKMKEGEEATEELQILQKVNHANLVKLMGVSCDSQGKLFFLVYEYAENGSLDNWLFCKSASSSRTESLLGWRRRLQIALDVANGLQYLHEHVQPKISHRDIRSSNILVDSRFRAKIANFSVAKSISEDCIPTKVDVFAFGVVLLELLSGKKAITVTEENGEVLLLTKEIKTVMEVSERRVEKLRNWMDPYLKSLYPVDGALSLAMLAMACTVERALARPSMAEVVFNLTVLIQSPPDWLDDEVWPEKKLDGEDILQICSPVSAR